MTIPLEQLTVETMASGHLSLTLTETVSWEQFPEYVAAIIDVLDATIETRADSAVERVWELSIDGLRYWIAFNDFALGVSLDSQNADASAAIPSIRERLLLWKAEHTA